MEASVNKQAIATINNRFVTCLESLKKIIPDSGYQSADAVSYGHCASILMQSIGNESRLAQLPMNELAEVLDAALLDAFTTYTLHVARISLLTRPQQFDARHSITLIAVELITESFKAH